MTGKDNQLSNQLADEEIQHIDEVGVDHFDICAAARSRRRQRRQRTAKQHLSAAAEHKFAFHWRQWRAQRAAPHTEERVAVAEPSVE
eukprot:7391485-Prymnesium_polylepis.2